MAMDDGKLRCGFARGLNGMLLVCAIRSSLPGCQRTATQPEVLNLEKLFFGQKGKAVGLRNIVINVIVTAKER
jgi:hypothetical protein